MSGRKAMLNPLPSVRCFLPALSAKPRASLNEINSAWPAGFGFAGAEEISASRSPQAPLTRLPQTPEVFQQVWTLTPLSPFETVADLDIA